MGEGRNSNAAGLLFCFTGHQSPSCTANEKDPGLADGLGEAANVQLGQKARAGTDGLMPPPSKARRPSFFVFEGSVTEVLLDRRYGFFTRPARARFSCTINKMRVRQALGHSGVGIIIIRGFIVPIPTSRYEVHSTDLPDREPRANVMFQSRHGWLHVAAALHGSCMLLRASKWHKSRLSRPPRIDGDTRCRKAVGSPSDTASRPQQLSTETQARPCPNASYVALYETTHLQFSNFADWGCQRMEPS